MISIITIFLLDDLILILEKKSFIGQFKKYIEYIGEGRINNYDLFQRL
jgi:hypothetical protein